MDPPSGPYYRSTAAIALPTTAFLSVLVCIPPLVWHSRTGNFPASCLIAWFVIFNFFNFINPLIWPTDDVSTWWDGAGLCDIETKLIAPLGTGIAGALVCIFRSLADVMDTDRATLIPSKGERRRTLAFEVVFCVVIPVLMMALHYVVQHRRYYLWAIVGCMPAFHPSWPSTALIFAWPLVVLFLAAIYCVLVIYRLFKYRQQFSYIVSISSNTSKSRFIRLLTLSLILLLGSFPSQVYVFYRNIEMSKPWVPYSWKGVHGPEWGVIVKVPMHGIVYYDRWIQVTCGFLLFAFFGFGKDATLMYRAFLIRVGLSRYFPSLEHPHIAISKASDSTRFGSFGSRAKTALKKKQSMDEYSPTLWSVRSNSESTNTTIIDHDHHFSSLAIINKPLPPAPHPLNSNSRVLSLSKAPVSEIDFESDTRIHEKTAHFTKV
ncbi:a-pheromone receptor PreA [Histoplasma capsulatum G186AR]|uniref:A-pheromone receptor PreA n=2 Tax=Ajellomyces capsulatus TaxID=5037 RepID=C0NDW8_AJECG|nr:a-pheromone receptor PreA [Histoplasma capsulatum G186AR]EEH10416.1 a-pheromone receptor PreA [Histoplasma capsulatum G186AR]